MKTVLDVCCGSKMFWFDKDNKETIYGDTRTLDTSLCDGRKLIIKPDVIFDFRSLPFKNEIFRLIVFDPPHMTTLGEKSWMAKKYGVLKSTWKKDIKDGFKECFRCLKHRGTLVFKWNESEIKTTDVLKNIDQKPLFGHTSGHNNKTKWIIFNKQTEG
jgi:hypothetical protein